MTSANFEQHGFQVKEDTSVVLQTCNINLANISLIERKAIVQNVLVLFGQRFLSDLFTC